MRRNIRRRSVIFLAMAALTAGCSFPGVSDTVRETVRQPKRILTTYAVLAGITKDIAGPDFDVDSLAPYYKGPVGFNVQHDRQYNQRRIKESDIFIGTGLDADRDIMQFIQDTKIKSIRLEVATSPSLKVEPWPKTDISPNTLEKTKHWRENPYLWLSIPNAIAISKEIERDMASLLPDKRDEFQKNENLFSSSLRELQHTTALRLSKVADRRVALSTPQLIYLAEDMGLDISRAVTEAQWRDAMQREDQDVYQTIARRMVEDGVVAVLVEKDTMPSDTFKKILRLHGIRIAPVTSFENSDKIITVASRGFEGLMKQNHNAVLYALNAPDLRELTPESGAGSLVAYVKNRDAARRAISSKTQTHLRTSPARGPSGPVPARQPESEPVTGAKPDSSGNDGFIPTPSGPMTPSVFGQSTTEPVDGIFAPVGGFSAQ